MNIRPCIDIHDGKVKQIVGGSLRDKGEGPTQNFVSQNNAEYFATVYREKNLRGGHIIMLNPAGTPEYEADQKEALEALRAFPNGMQIGGGICPDNAEAFLNAGASHVIVTSFVFREGRLDTDRLQQMKDAVGKEHLVLDLSCRAQRLSNGEKQYVVVTDRWQKFTELVINERNLEELSLHCDEFLIHAADVEGKRAGIELPLVEMLSGWQKKSGFPVTYAGGVHSLSDLTTIRNLSEGYMDVTVGSALDLFGGNLSLDELMKIQ